MRNADNLTKFNWSAYLLGFSFAGFFDGILLHQILQWHHLLSSIENVALQNLRMQILADGIFHAFMYVVALIGLLLFWRSRRVAAELSGRLYLANFLIGFGVWHIIDAVIVHWILGLHRIRPGSNDMLFWDLLFFAVGVIILLVGLYLRIRKQLKYPPIAVVLAIMVVLSGFIAAVPWKNTNVVTVVFRPDITIPEVFAAASAVDARLMWNNKAGNIWIFSVPDTKSALQLYRKGAWFVGGSLFGVGCFT
jgi:uncharacterized membrane protein